jgi:hypothetical protein
LNERQAVSIRRLARIRERKNVSTTAQNRAGKNRKKFFRNGKFQERVSRTCVSIIAPDKDVRPIRNERKDAVLCEFLHAIRNTSADPLAAAATMPVSRHGASRFPSRFVSPLNRCDFWNDSPPAESRAGVSPM